MAYLLDANVFIEAKNRHYGFDFCPAFWEWLIDRHEAEIVFSVEAVGKELKKSNDELASWASERDSTFFLAPPNPEMGAALSVVSNWVAGENYRQDAMSTFLGAADYYLVAHALAERHTVVTHEVAANSQRKVKIPNACAGVGIQSITPFDMLRHEGARFQMGPHARRSLRTSP
jgi:predicted nucleic acid-binding protein